MEISRLTVSKESLEKNDLTPERRRELREERIIEYINSRPYGARITLSEFQIAADVESNGQMDAIIKRMIKTGKIIRHENSPNNFSFTIPGAVNVIKPPSVINDTMDKVQKKNMRRALIEALISRKRPSTRIQMSEFQEAGNFDTEARAKSFVQGMIDAGIIKRYKLSSRTYSYSMVEHSAGVEPMSPVQETLLPPPATQSLPDMDGPTRTEPAPIQGLEELAMKFSWQHPDVQNDLREFVSWYNKRRG